MRYWIIGSGAAGKAAAKELFLLSPDDDIGLITQEMEPFYQRNRLIDLLSGVVTREEILEKSGELLARKDITIHAGKRVVRIDPRKKEIYLSDRTNIKYDKMLFALGAQPSLKNFRHVLDGIYTIRGISDIARIEHVLGVVTDVMVCGKGYLVYEITRALLKRGLKVHLNVSNGKTYAKLEKMADEKHLLELMEQAGVEITRNDKIVDFIEEEQYHHFAVTESGKHMFTQLLVLQQELSPVTLPARNSGLEVSRGILVNEFLETSDANVFAAGDCAEVAVHGPGTSRINFGWKSAEYQGRIAAKNMLHPRSERVQLDYDDHFLQLDAGDLIDEWTKLVTR